MASLIINYLEPEQFEYFRYKTIYDNKTLYNGISYLDRTIFYVMNFCYYHKNTDSKAGMIIQKWHLLYL